MPVKTIITGLPYFSAYIHRKLKAHFPDDRFVRLNTYYRFWDRIRFLLHIRSAHVVYSINGATHGSKVIDEAIRRDRRIIFHWVGSDVISARQDSEKKVINPGYLNKPTHLADAPWLMDELAVLGIKAQFLPLITFADIEETPSDMPEQFSVLTYIPQHKEEFYGIGHIIQLAEKFPHLSVRIAGLSSYNNPLPDNIRLLGWVKNMEEEIRRNSVCVRMPVHDGLSFFVIEALANQRYVIYNQPFEPCIFAATSHSLIEAVAALHLKHEQGILLPNSTGRDYIRNHFNETKVLNTMGQLLHG
jgi:hypothetical protein